MADFERKNVRGEQLVAGVIAQSEAIDERIKEVAANYELNRIATVDRNVLRVAIYEARAEDGRVLVGAVRRSRAQVA